MTYDINNTKKFIEQFTREDGLLELGKYNHDALAKAVVQDRQEAYNAGRQSGLEEVIEILDNNRSESLWGDEDSNEIMKISIDNFINAVETDLKSNK
jgi:hypothetical protein